MSIKRDKRRYRLSVIAGMFLLICCVLLSACGKNEEKTKVRVLIIPKFEIGEISGDFPGEAQLFYDRYCSGCEEIEIPNSPSAAQFYMNEGNGVGLLITDSGKTAANLSLMSLLSWDSFDFSDTTIVSVGCAGGSEGYCTFGDVVVVTSACDFDLGHRADSRELSGKNNGLTWFPDDSFIKYSSKQLNADLSEKVYQLVKDCPMRTTDDVRKVLEENFPGEKWALREPCVLKGTAVTGDCFWKGRANHDNASYIVEHYGCPDPYAVTEMEETAIMNTAECFGLQDRVISLRVSVNLDTFLKGESPEKLWLVRSDYNKKVSEENSETIDCFEPSMENLFDVGQIVIEAILAGEL